MAETKPLYDRGVKSGAIDGDGIMVGVPEGWRLMGAPPARCKSSHSLIFWEPINEDDCEPTLEKEVRMFLFPFFSITECTQVGACIHGAEKISPIFGDPKSAYIRLQCATAVHNLKLVLVVSSVQMLHLLLSPEPRLRLSVISSRLDT
jgi:hypothetical protein